MTSTSPFTSAARIEVVLPVPFDHGFDYIVPEDMVLEAGDYVLVPFGGRQLVGLVWGEGRQDVEASKCKTVLAHLAHIPAASENYRAFLRWVAWYYVSPLGMVLKLGLIPPKAMQKEDPAQMQPMLGGVQPKLSPAQAEAAHHLCNQEEGFSVSVLEGVTGAGKTEVYFEAIEKALSGNGQVLVLLPEIALTHQWVERCEKRFGTKPMLWHSSVTPAQRRKAWQGIARGEIRLVVGARSALFLPYPALSLIVVDEEHETSYKQDDGVLYHARDMAIARAKREDFAVQLVSATPSLETRENVKAGRYTHVKLTERHAKAQLPTTELIDMREAKLPASDFLSGELRSALADTLASAQQGLLFLNRRGYAPLMLCRTCGFRFQCGDCSSWMVLHKYKNQLQCHHCGHHQAMPKVCPECSGEELAACGPGVERIGQEASALFPQAKVAVLSSDDASYTETLSAMQDGTIDIIIGTQLLAKGHHFPKLTLVGVVDADMGLSGGDIRASEHTYQLLHQLGGRAGREQHAGRVLLQTFQPEHPVLQALRDGKEADFLKLEGEHRQMAGLPPFGRLACLLIDGPNESDVRQAAYGAMQNFPNIENVRLLGPAPAPLSKLRNQYRYRIILKAPKEVALQNHLRGWLSALNLPRNVRLKVDIDPYSFM